MVKVTLRLPDELHKCIFEEAVRRSREDGKRVSENSVMVELLTVGLKYDEIRRMRAQAREEGKL
jgi:hypothetical protein